MTALDTTELDKLESAAKAALSVGDFQLANPETVARLIAEVRELRADGGRPEKAAEVDPESFKPGLYRHCKGGYYIAGHLAHHHESRELMVDYYCWDTGTRNVREWATPGKDSWTDEVTLHLGDEEIRVARFEFVREMATLSVNPYAGLAEAVQRELEVPGSDEDP